MVCSLFGRVLLRDLPDADPAAYAVCHDALATYDVRGDLRRISAPSSWRRFRRSTEPFSPGAGSPIEKKSLPIDPMYDSSLDRWVILQALASRISCLFWANLVSAIDVALVMLL